MTKTIAPSAPRMTAGAPDQPKAVLTAYEVDLARHALGLPNKRRQSYRNHFVCGPGHTDFLAWESMAGVGLATKRKWSLIPATESIYMLTRQGAEAALLPGESLDTEDVFPVPANTPAPVDDAEEQVRVIAGTQSNPNPEGG